MPHTDGENVNGLTSHLEVTKQITPADQKGPPLPHDHELPRIPTTPTTVPADYMIPQLNKITPPGRPLAAGRLKYFIENWKLITSDKSVLETVGGYRIPLISKPHQWRKRVTKA